MSGSRPLQVVLGAGLAAVLTASCGSSTAPTTLFEISCPAAQDAQSPDGSPIAVSYPAPTTEGGTGAIITTCAPPSGSKFAVGSTSVSCLARDSRVRTASCTFTVSVTKTPRISLTRFLAFGDSITAGVQAPCPSVTANGFHGAIAELAALRPFINFSGSYPEQLQTRLAARYSLQTISVANEGCPGEAASVGPSPCDPSVTAAQRLHGLLGANPPPQVLLLQDGANDVNGGIVDALTLALRDMIRDARGHGVRVFVGTLLPQTPRACRAFGERLVVPANDQIRPMVIAEGAVLVDLYEGFQPDPGIYLGVDGLHPNPAGYQRVTELFFNSIREQLEVAP